MDANRHDFLKGTAWMGAVALAAGCVGKGALKLADTCTMQGFACAPMKKIRVGFVGLGGRGTSALCRVSGIPGCEVTGICDLRQTRLDACNKYLGDKSFKKAKEYCGPETYKRLCEANDVDVVYVVTG